MPRYYDKQGKELPADAPGDRIAESVYDIPIKPGIRFAPHPAFARDAAGNYLYHHLAPADIEGKYRPLDFAQTGTRELVAADFVYAIRRLATTRIESPSFSTLGELIVGLKEYGKTIAKADEELRAGRPASSSDLPFLDFRKYEMPGAVALDDHTLRIRIHGKYPQFNYWLQMTFFSPVPWEADAFYSQPGMAAHNLTLNYWPVGTGPYMVTEYVENRIIVMERNPNFHGATYPCEGEMGDREAGWLADCGKPLPFIDRIEARIEKEELPTDTKFLQGYLDLGDIWRYDYAIRLAINAKNSDTYAAKLASHGIQLPFVPSVSNWYMGFNWFDPVVGKGQTPEQQARNRKLRQAISIAVDWEQFVRIFEKKNSGVPAMSPVPPGVFGFRDGAGGINRVVYDVVDGKPVRKSIEVARKLVAEAGYPNGIDEKSGRPLVINYDYQRTLTPERKAEMEWMQKQFRKIGIQLEIRATDYNRFQDKMNNGTEQLFWWGWQADYPDAENYLFLLYGPNKKAPTGSGENAANYQNDEFDRAYEQFKYLEDGPEKQKLIDKMVAIVQEDAPWMFGFNPYAYGDNQAWIYNAKPAQMARDRLQYMRLDPVLRAQKLAEWNRPIWWPLWVLVAVAALVVTPAVIAWRRRERMTAGRTLAPSAS